MNLDEYILTESAKAMLIPGDRWNALSEDERDIVMFMRYNDGPASVFEIGMDLKMPDVEKKIDSLVRKGMLEKV